MYNNPYTKNNNVKSGRIEDPVQNTNLRQDVDLLWMKLFYVETFME